MKKIVCILATGLLLGACSNVERVLFPQNYRKTPEAEIIKRFRIDRVSDRRTYVSVKFTGPRNTLVIWRLTYEDGRQGVRPGDVVIRHTSRGRYFCLDRIEKSLDLPVIKVEPIDYAPY